MNNVTSIPANPDLVELTYAILEQNSRIIEINANLLRVLSAPMFMVSVKDEVVL